MANMTYGTPEYYCEQFQDFMADAQADQPEYGNSLVEGFLMSIADWRKYHQLQVDEYTRIEQRVREAFTV